jgi:hypothetical protein
MQRSAILRLGLGAAISAILLGVTLSRVDLAAAGAAIAAAAPLGLGLALVIVLADLGLRALRWRVLLDGVRGPAAGGVPFRLAFGYLMIGFLANAVLPARLGDVGRAYLAGTAFGVPRLAAFGTILVERVSDGLTMLGLALVAGLVVGAAAGVGDLVAFGLVISVAGAVAALVGWAVLVRTRIGRHRLGALLTDLLGRLGAGAGMLRDPRTAIAVLGMTAVVTTTAVLVAWAVTGAVGLALSPIEVVLFLSGVALSLAIPAAPGSLGTYEFVGVTIVTSLGYTPEQGLATILLMRLLTTVPPALLGVVALWALQIRPAAILRPAATDA